MSPSTIQNEFDRSAGALEEERTLRLIAALPAPQGIEERVKEKLRSAPFRTKVIAWPFSSAEGRGWMESAGMRAAAAAAIVLAIAGGGWGVYSHIQPAPLPTAVSVPQPLGDSAGGFNAAGAKRVPQTLEGPVLATPVVSKPKPEIESAAVPHKRSKHRAKKSVEPVQAAR